MSQHIFDHLKKICFSEISPNRIKVLYHDIAYRDLRDYTENFFAFYEDGGTIKAVYNHFLHDTTIDYGHEISDDRFKRYIHLAEFDFQNDQLTKIQETDKRIGIGSDPRVVVNNDHAYAYWCTLPPKKPKVYDLNNETFISIHGDIHEEYGKNWQPFLMDDRLLFIHSFEPFRVIEMNRQTGQLSVLKEIENTIAFNAFATNYSAYRGGSNSICVSDGSGHFLNAGIARQSAQPYRHQPVFWFQASKNAQPTFVWSPLFNRMLEGGFTLIDPVSILTIKGVPCFSLAATETIWCLPQYYGNFVIAYDEQNVFPNAPTLDDVLSGFKINNLKPDIRNHLFQCDRMQGGLNKRYMSSAAISNGLCDGHIVYGPYIKIEHPGYYTVELTGGTTADHVEVSGDVTFDCQVIWNDDDPEKETTFQIVDTIDLQLNNCAKLYTLVADLRQAQGAKVEFRVYASEGKIVIANNIRTRQHHWAIRCDHLSCDEDVIDVNGGRQTKNYYEVPVNRKEDYVFKTHADYPTSLEKKVICYGPYQPILNKGTYRITLHYYCPFSGNTEIGEFDLASHKAVRSPDGNLVPEGSPPVILQKCALYPSEGAMKKAVMDVSIETEETLLYETRVMVHNLDLPLRVNYITIDKIES